MNGQNDVTQDTFEDKEIICRGCGDGFVWTAGEQAFYANKMLNAPVRCKNCREARKLTVSVRREANHENT